MSDRPKPHSMSEKSALTTRLQKGGALLKEMRQLVWQWQEGADRAQVKTSVPAILHKATRARAEDTYRRAFYPRMLNGSPPNAWQIARIVEEMHPSVEIVRPIYYWITARSEPLLYKFATEELLPKSSSHDPAIRIEETVAWVERAVTSVGKRWSPTVRLKVARGLLAALRDFGVLEGATRKRLAPAHLPLESFCLLAFCLNGLTDDSKMLVQHPDWRLFLLTPTIVERLFLEAHQNGWLNYQAAGEIRRVEFPTADFRGYVHVVIRRNS